ncbi:hypothetical protein ILUMI_00990 [Ignelater luminosus]|uniref:Uncharacterized protein n=1 Tax=Ignelater luminosus TaxID=2038154 RepID=A0A8K0DF70_IGNLU|nr:hypothetical protein ILUMI_00990 [Ignelater luminosus]
MFFVRMANNWKECTRRPLSDKELEEIAMETLRLPDNVELSEFEDSDIEEDENAMNSPIEVEETEGNDEIDAIEPQKETDEADRKWRNYQLQEGAISEQFVGCVTPTDVFVSLLGDNIENVTCQSNLHAVQNKALKMTEGEDVLEDVLEHIRRTKCLPSR